MPEVAEAAVIADSLNKRLQGTYLHNVSTEDWKILQSLPDFEEAPLLESIYSTGKKVVFAFQLPDDDYVLVVSLGMTGRFLFEEGKHTRFTLTFTDSSDEETTLYYDDSRGIGSKAEFLPEDTFTARVEKEYGPDPLKDTNLPLEDWMKALDYPKSRARVSNAIKDQSKIHGIGNYLRSEILYLAGISPYRELNTLSEEEFEALIDAIITVVKAAYESGGYSMRDYFRPDGSRGAYQPMIYGRKGKTDEGYTIQYDKGSGGQSIYWAPEVQK